MIINRIIYKQMLLDCSSQIAGPQVWVNPNHMDSYPSGHVSIEGKIFKINSSIEVPQDQVRMSKHTQMFIYGMDQPETVSLEHYEIPSNEGQIHELQVYLCLNTQKGQCRQQFGRSALESYIRGLLRDMYLNENQYFTFSYRNSEMGLRVNLPSGYERGRISDHAKLNLLKEPHQQFQLVYEENSSEDSMEEEVEQTEDYTARLGKMKIGGLKQQVAVIARRVFASRSYGGRILQRLGIDNVKGMLLFGPPGTGKTLLARQISGVLGVQPKIVNGPQIIDKFVGEGERKIRELFSDAIAEYQQKGSDSSLHVIIFDEFDAVARKRGSHDSTIGDSLVNQLLTLIDGVDSPKNILVIGMTNRKDLIDDALLRSGRLEVHVEIYLPNEEGRRQIFGIHLNKMISKGYLSEDVAINELAKVTKNFTGAEIESLIKSTASFAMEDCKNKNMPISQLKIKREHFQFARKQIVPQFGQDQKFIENMIPQQMLSYGPEYDQHLQSIRLFAKKARRIDEGKILLLVSGVPGSGKTALAARCVKDIDFSFSKIINCDQLYSLSEQQKIDYLIRVFEDAKRCKDSCIILDDLLRLVEFIPLGARYNNLLLQLFLNLLKSSVEKNKKQVIIATSADHQALEDLGLSSLFTVCINLPLLSQSETAHYMQQQNYTREFALMASQKLQYSTIGQLTKLHEEAGSDEEMWLEYESTYRRK